MNNTETTFNFTEFLNKSQLSENSNNNYEFDRTIFSVKDSSNLNCSISKNVFSFCLNRDRLSKDPNKPVIIICSKDLEDVLKFSLHKLQQFKIIQNCDILLVDDRSSSSQILKLSDEYNTSYLRIDNQLNIFNYSIINNIAASYVIKRNKKTVIFSNNDLWPSEETTLTNLLDKHHNYHSDITGCKLLYPLRQDYIDIGKPPHLLQPYLDQIYNTIQHGGIHFCFRGSLFVDSHRKYGGSKIVLAPSHSWRFYKQNTTMASLDSRCFAVTGALQIINTDAFMALGGFNPSLGTAFQDIDLCVRFVENNKSVYYIGSEHMFHAESITNARDKITDTPDFISDNIMWDLLWSQKLPHLLGLQN